MGNIAYRTKGMSFPHRSLQLLAQQHLFFIQLMQHFEDLRSTTSSLGASYRNLGLRYFSFDMKLIFHQGVHSTVRGLARSGFVIAPSRELPAMIQVLGLLHHTLRTAADLLKTAGCADGAKLQSAQRLLSMADSWVHEAEGMLKMLEQAVEIYEGLRAIRNLEENGNFERKLNKRKREKMRDVWAHALPLMCWEGY